MITNDNDFYKTLSEIRDYLKSKTKDVSVSLEIASACNHLFTIKEKI